MKTATGFTHEAVISAGTLHRTQVITGGISPVQGSLNLLTILGGDQGIDIAKHARKPCLDLGQQRQAGFTTTGPHPTDPRTVKIKGVFNPGQRGGQKGGMPPEAEPHHTHGGARVTGS